MSEPVQKEGGGHAPETPPVVVKKYANRRLYNTESSSYITLDSLADMVRIGRDFVVYDAKSGEDITRSVLTQIIVEEESKGRALLPTGFLRQLIGFYGNSMQSLVPKYLEHALASFERQQQQMRIAMQQTMGNFFPGMEEVGRQNMAMMERAMSLFSPFYRGETPDSPGGEAAAGEAPKMDAELPAMPNFDREISTLRSELEPMRDHLTSLAKELTDARELAAKVEAENQRLRAEIELAKAAPPAPAPVQPSALLPVAPAPVSDKESPKERPSIAADPRSRRAVPAGKPN